jgi:hypothetical protein
MDGKDHDVLSVFIHHNVTGRLHAESMLRALQHSNTTHIILYKNQEVFGVSVITQQNEFIHYKIMSKNRRIGFCKSHCSDTPIEYMDTSTFLRVINTMGLLALAPRPRRDVNFSTNLSFPA